MNKLTVTRGEEQERYGGKQGKGSQGTCITDTWTKSKGIGSRVGGGGVGGRGPWCGENGEKWT